MLFIEDVVGYKMEWIEIFYFYIFYFLILVLFLLEIVIDNFILEEFEDIKSVIIS